MVNKEDVVKKVVEFYLQSSDFNGIPLKQLNIKGEQGKKLLENLVGDNLIVLNYGDRHPNPHILALPTERIENRLEKLANPPSEYPCVYPTPESLRAAISENEYSDRPFTRRLALGEPQLSHLSFDLHVLEIYRNDPRYSYKCNDIAGNIYYTDEQLSETDRVFLQTFGFSYDNDFNRAVAVFLRYLSDLTPEHQQLWNARLVKGNYLLHPDYYRSSILGQWHEKISIFTAYIEELYHINKMCELMDRPHLFKNDFREDEKPRGFGFLIRPTLKEINDFIHLLDKMMSENLQRSFFQNEVSSEIEDVRKDGKVIVRQKGTIQILDDWLRLKFRPIDPTPMEEMIAAFKNVRKRRQRPAHAIDDNRFDQTYFKEQRDLIILAYEAVRTLRLIFENHPNVHNYEIPEVLREGKIWTF